MKPLIPATVIFVCCLALIGCMRQSDPVRDIPGAEPDSPGHHEPALSEHETAPDADTFEIRGTVVYQEIEGGFFAIDSDDGKKYNPANLPESYRKDGLQVKITARPEKDAMSIHMYGALIEIVEIALK
jgi:hypothetical protein